MPRLDGMTQITDYVKRSDATVLGYIRFMEFPAAKLGNIWVSDTKDIDKWFDGILENNGNGKKAPAATKKRAKKRRVK